MYLMKCCCCFSLRFGTLLFGIAFAIMDFYLGTLGLYYAIGNDLPHYLIVFFDKMDARKWVFYFSLGFYVLTLNHVMLIIGTLWEKPALIGTWIILDVIILVFTITPALIHIFWFLRLGLLLYALLVINSYYEDLID